MLLALLFLGTWPAIMTLTERRGRLPQHTYLDYTITNLLAAVIIAFTLGQIGPGRPNFITQLSQVSHIYTLSFEILLENVVEMRCFHRIIGSLLCLQWLEELFLALETWQHNMLGLLLVYQSLKSSHRVSLLLLVKLLFLQLTFN